MKITNRVRWAILAVALLATVSSVAVFLVTGRDFWPVPLVASLAGYSAGRAYRKGRR